MIVKPIKIGKRWIGIGNPCYIIAEIGSNFDGKISQAKRLIKYAKKSGADAAKFQSFLTEKILSKKGFEQKSTFQSKWEKSVWEVYKEAEFPLSWHKELSKYCKQLGIDFLSTPYYTEAVDELIKIGTPAIKIGSGEISNLEFLKYIAKTKKPIFLATGSSTMIEIEKAVNTIKRMDNTKIVLMQAVTQYPSPIEEANLKVLETYKKKFGLNVGYSDHSLGDLVILGSIALDSCVIEKHFTLDTKLEGPDHPHSMDYLDFKKMIRKVRILEAAMGDGIKKVEKSEKQTRIIQRRGLWSIKSISKGELFTKQNIELLRPVMGLPASKYEQILGKKARRNLKPFSPVSVNDYN